METLQDSFIVAKGTHLNHGENIIIQTGGLQLIGAVRKFFRNEKGEFHRRRLLDGITDEHYIAKAAGHRVYVTLAGSLKPIEPEDMPTPSEVKKLLGEMAGFYLDYIKDGDRSRLADRGPWAPKAEDADSANRWDD